MSLVETLLSVLAMVARKIADVAPGVIAAFTGGQSVEDAIEAAEEAIPDALAGKWADDLARREAELGRD